MSLEVRAAPTSRRKVLTASGSTALGAAAILLGGCGKKSGRPRVAEVPPAARSADIEILNRVLDLEYMAVAAYTAGIPLLTGAGRSSATHFLTQELSHAGELSGLVKQASGIANLPRSNYDLGHPRSGADVLTLLHALESAQITAYLDAIPRLSPGSVRAAVASILANEAQHVSVLRSALGRAPVPSAFVTGGE